MNSMNFDPIQFARKQAVTRRHFLGNAGALGVGSIALSTLLNQRSIANPQSAIGNPQSDNPLAPRCSHFAPKAKRVIFLHMSGGPPHLDMFDYKPELVKRHDQDCPESLLKGKTFAFTSGVPKLLGTSHIFTQHGQSGAWLSEVVPQIGSIA